MFSYTHGISVCHFAFLVFYKKLCISNFIVFSKFTSICVQISVKITDKSIYLEVMAAGIIAKQYEFMLVDNNQHKTASFPACLVIVTMHTPCTLHVVRPHTQK